MSESNCFGAWSIDQKVFGWILSNIPVGSSVLEVGSGWATGELARYYTMTSIEDELYWYNKFQSNYIYAPSVNEWYDRKILDQALNSVNYNLLLIDGPQHHQRKNIMNNLDLFNWSVPVILDDVQEPDMMSMGERISTEVCKRPFEIISGEKKKAMVIK